ncbi:choice-of-anchor Q domain-containing protein [Archangium violaceum]|uniref:choice-of-anchor Q domain-containing protein n=1 Tax=Archangium violaceum TaxID=83451 RepID=UPI00069835A1|nr:choice-of-anchor Q domain-containing protein [Archangium violaceum]
MRASFLPFLLSVTLLIACPSVPGTDADGGTRSDAGTSGDGGTWPDGGLEPQPASCEAPALVDVSTPTTVVGDGTAESCTAAALQAAATRGGVIVFNCGEFPVTLTVSSPITFTKAAVLDGGGRITLSGGGTSRILLLDSAYDVTGPLLVVQRLTFRDGRSAGGGEDTAVGGGAIYRDGGSLKVIGCTFVGNRAPSPGQDIAGGAIYGFGGGETVIVGSTFIDNAASNGGAVGSLNGDLTLINSTFTGNAATGYGGNPGNGGCGGAIYMDGADEVTTLCGVRMTGNEAGAIGGGFFRVSNHNNGTFTMDRATVDANRVTATDSGNAGGMYLQGLTLRMTNSTVSRNKAFYNGGLWLHTSDVQLTNVTVAENTAFGSNGGGLWLSDLRGGTLLNCTIANNRSTARDQIAGAIFGGGLTLQNTLIAGNTAMWVPGCNETHAGQGNLEWPGGAECTASPLVADPLLGGLGYHGGDTETLVPGATNPARGLGTGCPSTDQRGQPRAERCTAGAVELP